MLQEKTEADRGGMLLDLGRMSQENMAGYQVMWNNSSDIKWNLCILEQFVTWKRRCPFLIIIYILLVKIHLMGH